MHSYLVAEALVVAEFWKLGQQLESFEPLALGPEMRVCVYSKAEMRVCLYSKTRQNKVIVCIRETYV
jgi:hypothetical protein